MKKMFLVVFGMVVFQTGGITQARVPLQFWTQNAFGMLAGESTNALQIQSINGVKYKTYSIGVGAGIDNYFFKTIPLFVDVRKNILNKKQTPFAYGDIGTNFPRDRSRSDGWKESKLSHGLYFDLGIGYQWVIKGRLGFNAAFGYSHKRVKETASTFVIYDFPPYGNYTDSDVNDYTFRRFSFKAGLSF